MKVVLASKNKHKLEEISKITEKFGFELILQSQLGVDIDVEETGSTFEENSFLKAEAVMKATGLPALADDSGIAVIRSLPFCFMMLFMAFIAIMHPREMRKKRSGFSSSLITSREESMMNLCSSNVTR